MNEKQALVQTSYDEQLRIAREKRAKLSRSGSTFPKYATGYSAVEQFYDLFDPGYVNDYSYQQANR